MYNNHEWSFTKKETEQYGIVPLCSRDRQLNAIYAKANLYFILISRDSMRLIVFTPYTVTS